MKARTLGLSFAFAIMLISVSMGVNAQTGGPSYNSMGPGSGPGMNEDEHQGPRWEQQTENKQMEKGLMFRYGMETPETSLESTDTGKDIGIKILQLKFKNDTADMDIQVEDEEWELREYAFEGHYENVIGVQYNSTAQWKSGEVDSGSFTEISIQFSCHEREGERYLDYGINVEDIPGKGNLSISLGLDTRNMAGGCCWSDDTPMQQKHGKMITLRNEDGKELSQLMVYTGTALIGEEYWEINSTVEGTIVNSTAVMDVNMDLPLETKDANFRGSLTIMDGLFFGFEEAAEFVIDHIYYFAGGAVVMTVIIILGITVVSKKKIDTNGKELDLGSNKYYRGPQ